MAAFPSKSPGPWRPEIIVLLLALVIVRTEFEVRVKPPTETPGSHAMKATVIGHQWWWEYVIDQDDDKQIGVVTANELHVPASGNSDEPSAARPVYLTLKSADVCHSFWVPRLAGKNRFDSRPHKSNVVSNRAARFICSVNAPNTVARSTQICCCACMSIHRKILPLGYRMNKNQPSTTPHSVKANKLSWLNRV